MLYRFNVTRSLGFSARSRLCSHIRARVPYFFVLVSISTVSHCSRSSKTSGSTAPSVTSVTSSYSTAIQTQIAVSQEPSKAKMPTHWVGTYNATLASVRTPAKAPKFMDQAETALGLGKLTIHIPIAEGQVTGTSTGALGFQTFSGIIQGNKLTGSLRPEPSASVQMWGTLQAEAEGSGRQKIFKGSIRASSNNGRIVRESMIELKPEVNTIN